MTLLVAGILLGIGVPNVLEFSRNASMTAAANDFVTAMLMARTEAVKRQAPVTLCLSDNPTDPNPTCVAGSVSDSLTRGFVVFVDENNNVDADGARILTDATDGNAVIDAGELVLSQTAAPGANSNVRLSSSCGHFSFAPTGFMRAIAAQPCNTPKLVLLCDDRGRKRAAGDLSAARVVRIPSAGRAQVLSEVAQVTTLNALLNGPLHNVPTTCPP
jgi:type IV fimbrial biogenesis protein FimT